MQRDRHAADVHQLERAHADAEHALGDLVNGDRVADVLFEHPDRFHQPDDEEAIDHEAAVVARFDGNLAELLLQRPCAMEHLPVGRRAGNDLDEPVLRGMEEVVQPQHARGRPDCGRDVGDEIGRGVGREDRVRPADGFEPPEHVLFDRAIFEHRFDDEIRVAEVVEPRCAVDPVAN